MLFNSFPFLFLFLPFVVTVYALVRQFLGQRFAQAFLLVSSLLFYS
jgi:hypothetical protein